MKNKEADLLPTMSLKGRWDEDDPNDWETFSIALKANVAGDFLDCRETIERALFVNGYRIVLERTGGQDD